MEDFGSTGCIAVNFLYWAFLLKSVDTFKNIRKTIGTLCKVLFIFVLLSRFYILLTVHLGKILVNNQLDLQFFFIYVYVYSVHVSVSHVPIIRRINCINTTSGIYHSV